MKALRVSLFVGLLASVLMDPGTTTRADIIARVSLDTTALIGHPAGPFLLDFQLNSGGTPGVINTASLTEFQFSGGAAIDPAILSGDVTGSLESHVTLTTSQPFNDFMQQLTPGASLAFTLDLTTNMSSDPSTIPDQFSFAILDSSLVEIPTLDPSGGNTLLTINIDSTARTALTFATDPSQPPPAGGPSISMPPPILHSAVPEPSSFLLAAVSLATLFGLHLIPRLPAVLVQESGTEGNERNGV